MTALPHGRYLKQIKVRSAPIEYHEGNVLKMSIEKRDKMLRFDHTDSTDFESNLIGEADKDSLRRQRYTKIVELKQEGLSLRQIADRIGLSKSTVERVLMHPC